MEDRDPVRLSTRENRDPGSRKVAMNEALDLMPLDKMSSKKAGRRNKGVFLTLLPNSVMMKKPNLAQLGQNFRPSLEFLTI